MVEPEVYRWRVARRGLRVFVGGERVGDLLDHPVTRTVVEANAKVYELALDPRHREVMTAFSPLIGGRVNRSLHLCGGVRDLEMRAAMALLTSQKLGTCNYRCPGCDVLHGLASVTWEMDRDLGTEYHRRLMAFLEHLQREDLALSGAVTDSKGDRGRRPGHQDPDMYVRVVERRSDGIVVRGAKQHQSGAYAADWTLVMPTGALREGEEDYAVAFAFPAGEEGVTYICQYNAYTVERLHCKPRHLGNPLYGQRETSLIVFDDVFVPWERVFMCGEVAYSQRAVVRFSKMHRMNCGGACKVGFADLLIGGAALMAEFNGVDRSPHIVEKLTRMVQIRETAHACAVAAALKGREEPPGSGVYLPEDLFSNVAKLNICEGFWELMALAGDIGGGVVVSLPWEGGLEHPEIAPHLEKYYRAAAPARERMRMARFLQSWTAGMHGVATWHGAGSAQTQKLTLYRSFDFESRKEMARELAGLKRSS